MNIFNIIVAIIFWFMTLYFPELQVLKKRHKSKMKCLWGVGTDIRRY